MSSPNLLDFDTLLAPVDGENPAGAPVPFAVRDKLEEARREIDPDAFDADDPTRPTEAKFADWRSIVRLALETLTQSSKDLLVAARLTEALTCEEGFAGLRDGLRLMHRLVEECWERILPSIEDGDLEVRAGPFNWLDDPDHGAHFPLSVRGVPLVNGDGRGYSWQDWKQLQDGRGNVPRDAFEKAVGMATREHCQALKEDLDECAAELEALSTVLQQKLGEEAPGLSSLRQAIQDCQGLAGQLLQRKGPAPATASEEEQAPGEEEGGADGRSGSGRAGLTRADVYQRLAEAADLLQQVEPHSPIPYLIRRAVELGALPFPQLMRALIRDDAVLQEMNRELGIKEESSE